MKNIDDFLKRTLEEDKRFLKERKQHLKSLKEQYPDDIDSPDFAGLQEIIDDLEKGIRAREERLKQKQKTKG